MITLRRSLERFRVVRAITSAAVPEHSSCTEGTSRNAANTCSSESRRAPGTKSRHVIGRPAVGGTSRQRLGMALLRLADAEKNDSCDDAGRAGEFCYRKAFAE